MKEPTASLLLAALVSASILLTDCSLFIPDVHDLHLVDVRPAKHAIADPTTPDEGAPDQSPNHSIGRIDVATQSDVVKIVQASELTLWARLNICQSGAMVSDYGVTSNGVELFEVGSIGPRKRVIVSVPVSTNRVNRSPIKSISTCDRREARQRRQSMDSQSY